MIKKLGKSFVLFTLRTLASIQLKKHRAKIVGVTGSVGKTSLVEACALVLKTRFKLLKLREGYNSEFGVPLVILDQKTGFSSPTAWMKTLLGCFWKVISDWKKYDLVLLEMGVDKPNDMKYLTSFIKPYASIFLNVFPVHTENFSNTKVSQNNASPPSFWGAKRLQNLDPDQARNKDSGQARMTDSVSSTDLLRDVFKEKSILIKKTKPEGFVVLNADDPMIKTLAGKIKPRIIWFGSEVPRESHLGGVNPLTPRELEGSIAFHNVSVDSKGLSFKIKINRHSEAKSRRISDECQIPHTRGILRFTQDDGKNVKDYSVLIPNILGKEYAYTFSTATALGLGFGISAEESIEAIKGFKLPPGRLNVLNGIKDTILVDSSYNASRLSMIQALNVLKLHKNKKRIAVLGDMRELGKYTEEEHQAVAREAVKAADELVLLGPLMKKYFYPETIKLGFDKKKIYSFQKAGEVLEFLKKHLKGEEVILFKGSQNTIFLEIVVEGLLKNPSDASLLCRRGPEWTRLRQLYM